MLLNGVLKIVIEYAANVETIDDRITVPIDTIALLVNADIRGTLELGGYKFQIFS